MDIAKKSLLSLQQQRCQAPLGPLPQREPGTFSPKQLLKALEERFRLYQVLKEEGLVNRNKAENIQSKIANAMAEIEELLKT